MDRQHHELSRRLAAMALAASLLMPRPGVAAGLDDSDGKYLRSHFGTDATAYVDKLADREKAKLHELINDPNYKDYPEIAADNVAQFLFEAHTRYCGNWHESHAAQLCPPPADPALLPGKEIAERSCNTCHLYGTIETPSFYRLAQQGGLTAERLATSLASGHRMSPITLAPDQVESLTRYIRSVK